MTLKRVQSRSPITWGILGYGMMGSIMPAAIGANGGEIKAVLGRRLKGVEDFVGSNPHLSRVEYIGELGDTDKPSEDFEQILEDPSIDAIYVGTPNFQHGLAAYAAEAGKAVLIEKPFAVTAEKARNLEKRIVAANVAADVASQYRYNELLTGDGDISLKGLIESEAHGGVMSYFSEYMQGWMLESNADIGVRAEIPIAGKGKLIGDLGSHGIVTNLTLFGDGADIEDFKGDTYNHHQKRFVYTGPSLKTFETPPSVELSPELYKEIDVLNDPNYSSDDLARATYRIRTNNRTFVGGCMKLSQVEENEPASCRQQPLNQFNILVQFMDGNMYKWENQDRNVLKQIKPEGGEEVVYHHRHSGPSLDGRPGGHDKGYIDDAITMVKGLHEMIRTNDNEARANYTARNMFLGRRSSEITEQWGETPVKIGRPESF